MLYIAIIVICHACILVVTTDKDVKLKFNVSCILSNVNDTCTYEEFQGKMEAKWPGYEVDLHVIFLESNRS
jgi:hypothetical protein